MTKIISGGRKYLIDIRVFIKLYVALIKEFGFWNARKELRKYLDDKRNTFIYSPNRYVINDKNIYVLPDLPPINSADFTEYFISEVEAINHNKDFKLLFAIICISARCPNKCEYCYNITQHQDSEPLAVETIIKTVKELQGIGIKNIYLSGGEPMMRYDDIPEIIKQCNDKRTGLWLLTCGYMADKQNLSNLKKLGLRGVMVGLDYYEEDFVVSVKKRSNAFAEAINCIKAANEAGLVVAVNSVFNQKLLEKTTFDDFLKFLKGQHVHFVNCYAPRITNKDTAYYHSFNIEKHKQLANLSKKSLKGKYYKRMPLAYSPDEMEAKKNCIGGKIFIYIDPLGNVHACPFIDYSYGNINDKGILEILENMKSNKNRHICGINEMLKGEFDKG